MLRNSHDDESKESIFFQKLNSPFQSSLTSAALNFIQGPEESGQRSPMTGSCSPDRNMVQTPPGLSDESKESTHIYEKRSKVRSVSLTIISYYFVFLFDTFSFVISSILPRRNFLLCFLKGRVIFSFILFCFILNSFFKLDLIGIAFCFLSNNSFCLSCWLRS